MKTFEKTAIAGLFLCLALMFGSCSNDPQQLILTGTPAGVPLNVRMAGIGGSEGIDMSQKVSLECGDGVTRMEVIRSDGKAEMITGSNFKAEFYQHSGMMMVAFTDEDGESDIIGFNNPITWRCK
ncbi:MAG: hypothetical protein AAF570_04900 [Bacteroidota bacterium]